MNRKSWDKEKVKDDEAALLKGSKKPVFVGRLRGFMIGIPKNGFQVLIQLAEPILRDE